MSDEIRPEDEVEAHADWIQDAEGDVAAGNTAAAADEEPDVEAHGAGLASPGMASPGMASPGMAGPEDK